MQFMDVPKYSYPRNRATSANPEESSCIRERNETFLLGLAHLPPKSFWQFCKRQAPYQHSHSLRPDDLNCFGIHDHEISYCHHVLPGKKRGNVMKYDIKCLYIQDITLLHCGLRGYEISKRKMSLLQEDDTIYVLKVPFSASS